MEYHPNMSGIPNNYSNLEKYILNLFRYKSSESCFLSFSNNSSGTGLRCNDSFRMDRSYRLFADLISINLILPHRLHILSLFHYNYFINLVRLNMKIN